MNIQMPEKVNRIIETLLAHGHEAYAVGGCVRDSLLGREADDWDITTSASPYEVKELFRRTIDTGMTIFNEKMAEHKAQGKTVFSGADAFLLSATYGFPIDLTAEMVEDEGMTLDVEGFNALPGILLSITLITILGNGVDKLIIAMVLVRLPSIARLVRQQVLSLKEKEFVECARACGASDVRIIFKHILPQCTSPLIIRFTSGLGGAILSQASLAFLGVGMDPRIPNWGGIINEGRAMVMAMPYQCAYAGIAIMITTLAFSILGDGVRDILDPKLR